MILILLLFPLAISARFVHDGIFVSIKPGPSEAETTIADRGTDIKLLTEQEQSIFHLTKDNIKKAVETVSHQKPTEVFIRETEDDLYKIYKWREVKRNFELKYIKIANVTTEVEKQSERIYTNNGTEKESVQANAYEDHFSFHSTHDWSGNDQVMATVRYELVRPGKQPLNYAYGSAVGADSFSSGVNSISYGYTAAKFDLNPGQAAKFIVSASTVTNNIIVGYETTLIGDVVVRYADKLKGKEFWSYDVNGLLRALNLTTVIEMHEFVTISYIKDYPVKVIDVANGKDIPYSDLVTPEY